MKSQFNSLYDAVVNGLSAVTSEAERSLINRLNACERHMGELYANIKKVLPALDKADRLDAESLFTICKYLLQYDRKNLWNPINEDGSPDMDSKRLLGEDGELTAEEYLEIEENRTEAYHKLSDVEKLRVNQMADKGQCGTNVHRLAQIAFGLGKIFLEDEGIVTLKDKEKDKLQAGEYDEKLLDSAIKYHEDGSPSTSVSKSQDKDESDEASDEVPTLEMYEKGEISPKDVEDEDMLSAWYEQVESTGKKAAITKELNKREREAEEN